MQWQAQQNNLIGWLLRLVARYHSNMKTIFCLVVLFQTHAANQDNENTYNVWTKIGFRVMCRELSDYGDTLGTDTQTYFSRKDLNNISNHNMPFCLGLCKEWWRLSFLHFTNLLIFLELDIFFNDN